MNNFRKDRNYLLRYATLSLLGFVVVNVVLFYFKRLQFDFTFSTVDLLLPFSSLFLFGVFGSLIHNSSHGSVGPRFFNNLVGELCGVFLLYGFREFKLFHLLHHISPDDPEGDPQPAVGYSMLYYFMHPIKKPFEAIGHAYYENFGKSEEADFNLKMQKILISFLVANRVAFWFLLLGPKYFLVLYFPIYFSNILFILHANLSTHVEREDGSVEVVDFSEGHYYKYANFLSFGSYYHKSHHLKPMVFNPSTIKNISPAPYITYAPKTGKKSNSQKEFTLIQGAIYE